MNREEFENLTGITVSYSYYTESIEPEYMDGSIDKQAFCAQWVKAHKADICKALMQDMSRMSRDAAVTEATIAQLERITIEQKDEIAVLKKDNEFRKNMDAHQQSTFEDLKAENKKLNETADALEISHRELLDAAESHEKALEEKDREIMKLKAMLFDQMYKIA